MKRISIILSAIALVLVAGGILVMTSCNSHEGQAPGVSNPEPVGFVTPGQTGQIPRDAGLYTSQSQVATMSLASSIGNPLVVPQMRKFEAMGYSYAPQYSFVVQGKGMPDSAEFLGIRDSVFVRITTFAMVNNQDPMGRACYVNYAESDYGTFVEPYILAFTHTRPAPEYETVIDGLFACYFEPIRPMADARTVSSSASWDWSKWGKCTLEHAAEGCGVAAADCLGAGPGWPECAGAGCAGATVGSAIGCALSQVFFGKK